MKMRTHKGVTREDRDRQSGAGETRLDPGHLPARVAGRRGAALVEFAIVLPLLMTLLLGIMEFGMIMHDYIMLAQGTREGARTAAIGRPVGDIQKRVMEAAALRDLRPAMVQITAYDTNTGAWVAVADKASGRENSVVSDGIVRVTVKEFPHRMVTGNFFSFLPGYSNGYFKLNSSLTMRRE